MDPWRPAPKQRLLGSKGNTSSVSTQLPGHPAASPKVVISRASRHQVVDAHGARLPDAVHPVLSLHQHLRGGDRDACRSRLEAAQPTTAGGLLPQSLTTTLPPHCVSRGRGPASLCPQTVCHLTKGRSKHNTGQQGGPQSAAG